MRRRELLLLGPLLLAAIGVGAVILRGGGARSLEEPAPGETTGATAFDPASLAASVRTTPSRFAPTDGVRGIVTDPRNVGIPGAKVTLLRTAATGLGWRDRDGDPIDAVLTDADGAFLLGPVASDAAAWRVRAEADGYVRRVVDAGAAGAALRLVLVPGGSLSVRVEDGDGSPISGAFVRAGENDPRTRVVTTTGGDGEARLDGLPFGGTELYAEAPGYGAVAASDAVVAPGAVARRTLVLPAAIELTGRVSDPAGAAVAGALVSAGTRAAGPAAPLAEGTTDAEGRFALAISGMPGARVEVRATKSGLGETAEWAELRARAPGEPGRGGDGVDVLLAFVGTTPISGRVVATDGRPAPGSIVVWADTSEDPPAATLRAVADGEGRFTIPMPSRSPAPPIVALVARSAEHGTGVLRFEPARTSSPLIRLFGAGSATGVVRAADGSPVDGAVVALQLDLTDRRELPEPSPETDPRAYQRALSDPRLPALCATTDTRGVVRFLGVPRGTYRPRVSRHGVPGGANPLVTVTAGGSTAFEATWREGGRIEGRVVDTAGVPVVGARVEGWDTGGNVAGEVRRASARTDAEGRFALRDALGDLWNVSANAPGFLETRTETVRIGATDVVVRLTPLGWIDGVVVGADGRPRRGAFRVVATTTPVGGDDDAGLDAGAADGEFSSPEGAFRLKGLAAGKWTVTATTAEGLVSVTPATAVVVVGAGAGPVELRLTAGCALSGVVRSDTGRSAVTAASGSVRIVGGAESGGRTEALFTTDASGRFVVEGLAAGAYRVSVTDASGGSARDEVRLAPGGRAQRELVIRRPGTIRIRVVDGEGRPVPRARVEVFDDTGTAIPLNWELLRREGRTAPGRAGWESLSMTGPDGLLTRAHVPPGRVSVVAHGDGVTYEHEPAAVDVETDRTVDVTVTVGVVGREDGR